MDTATFVKEINTLRKINKSNWYWWKGDVNNNYIKIKGYETWLQIAENNEIRFSFGMDISVAKFTENLVELAEYKHTA